MKMLFLIGAPRSGTTLLERILSAHSLIQGGSEPHLLTPLAHLGVWRNVDKAPFDHIVAAIGQKDFIAYLPNQEQDYWLACRAYCDTLYNAYLSAYPNKLICLDKTPEYATILPFITKLYPDAKYIVLSRHPAAIFSSFANSFFDGDWQVTQAHDPILSRYIPAMAHFIRQEAGNFCAIRYEDLVADPDAVVAKLCDYLEIPFEPSCINYGENNLSQGLGDPLGVGKFVRPSLSSLDKWAEELQADPNKLSMMKNMIADINPEDLRLLGYPPETLWQALEKLQGKSVAWKKPKLSRYLIERKLIVRLRQAVQSSLFLQAVVKKMRLVCDVLLREY
ncbi:sulfotransferase [Methylosoma difficile]